MNWASTAILSAAILGIVRILDSHLIARRMPGFQSFLLLAGVFILILALPLFYLFPLPEGAGAWPVLAASASGMLRAGALGIVLYTLKREDVSRVTPVSQTFPIFVAIMAVPLLGETLHYLDWLAIIIVVAGAAMISIEKSQSSPAGRITRPFAILFISSLLFAVANIATKYSLTYITFWNSFTLTACGMSGVFLLLSMRSDTFKQLKAMRKKGPAIALLAVNEMLAFTGSVLVFRAMASGPVSLVSAILGSVPIFVTIYALVLGRIAPGFIIRSGDKGMLALRLVATVMIVGGLAIIYLA